MLTLFLLWPYFPVIQEVFIEKLWTDELSRQNWHVEIHAMIVSTMRFLDLLCSGTSKHTLMSCSSYPQEMHHLKKKKTVVCGPSLPFFIGFNCKNEQKTFIIQFIVISPWYFFFFITTQRPVIFFFLIFLIILFIRTNYWIPAQWLTYSR